MDHYFTNNKINSNIFKISSIIKNKTYSFYVDNGVFSKTKVDFGTKLLLETIQEVSMKKRLPPDENPNGNQNMK